MEEQEKTAVKAPSLKALVPKDDFSRTTEVTFRGVKFRVRYMSRTHLFTIGQQCTVLTYDSQRKTRTNQLDPIKLSEMLGAAMVAGWEGLTFRTIQNLMVLENADQLTQEQLDMPVEFTPENVSLLLSNSPALSEALQDISSDPSNFRSGNAEELEKN